MAIGFFKNRQQGVRKEEAKGNHELGTSLMEIKSEMDEKSKETIREIKAQSESLFKQGELLQEHSGSFVKQEALLMNQKETLEKQSGLLESNEVLLKGQGEVLESQAELLATQSAKLDIQIAKLESVLSNFPKLEENIVKRTTAMSLEKQAELSNKLDRLTERAVRNSSRNILIVLSFILNIITTGSIIFLVLRMMGIL